MATSCTGLHADGAEDPLAMTDACHASTKNPTPPSSSEDSIRKIRKPYTITKSRESWTEQEHDKFVEAIQLFDRDWKKIESYVGSKTVVQIRSHAQKYFMKVQKNGTSGHVPPPQPNRKAIHLYPPKASENGQNLEFSGSAYLENLLPTTPSHGTLASQSSSCLLEPGFAFRANPSSMNSFPIAHVSSSLLSSLPPANASHMMEVMPDLAQVYAFVGSIFDPNTSGHLERLKGMDPVNVNAALLLIKNLAINLSSLNTEDQRKLLSLYTAESLQNPNLSNRTKLPAYDAGTGINHM